MADRGEELKPKSAAVVKTEGQLAKIRKTSTPKMQNEIISIQLAQSRAGGAAAVMPVMPGMGFMSPPIPPQMWPGMGAPPPLGQPAASALQPSLAPGGARLVPVTEYLRG